jgi:predicted heme/steroid binding protein
VKGGTDPWCLSSTNNQTNRIEKVKELSPEELSRYTGKDGNLAYIAYRGIVYDVTESFLWKNGKHQVLHEAGRDLTEELDDAPHGPNLLERVPVVGKLKKK